MPIVIDLEATCCDDGTVPRARMEIIEIGAVAVSRDGDVQEVFSEFVRPVRHPELTPFCTELTTITQADVDAADGFVAVSKRFAAFVSRHRSHTASPHDWWGSWGDYDANQLAQDVRFHRAITPLPMRHRNLKAEFTARQGLRKRFGLAGAVRLVGLDFVGTHHRGVDDARNIARLLPWIDGEGRVAAGGRDRAGRTER